MSFPVPPAAHQVADAAIVVSAERGRTIQLPYCPDVHARLCMTAASNREYVGIDGRTFVEVTGEHESGEWRVTLRMQVEPQAARYR